MRFISHTLIQSGQTNKLTNTQTHNNRVLIIRALRSRSLCDGSALRASIDSRCAALLRIETNHLEL